MHKHLPVFVCIFFLSCPYAVIAEENVTKPDSGIMSRLDLVEASIDDIADKVAELEDQLDQNKNRTTTASDIDKDVSSCGNDPDWSPLFKDLCFKVLPGWYNWDEADAACKNEQIEGVDPESPQLLDVGTSEEQQRVTEVLSEDAFQDTTGIWLRLKKDALISASFTNWSPSSPTSFQGRNCVEIRNEDEAVRGLWLDMSCRRTSGVVCTKRMLSEQEGFTNALRAAEQKIDTMEETVLQTINATLQETASAIMNSISGTQIEAQLTAFEKQLWDNINATVERALSKASTVENEGGLEVISPNAGSSQHILQEFQKRVVRKMAQLMDRVEMAESKGNIIHEFLFEKIPTAECGGVFVRQAGSIIYTPPAVSYHPRTCIWTLRASTYENINIRLLKENFAASGATLTLTPMWLFKKPNVSSSMIQSSQRNWSSGSSGQEAIIEGPVVFVELRLNGTSVTVPPQFEITFWGTGNYGTHKALRFEHLHLKNSSGFFLHRNYTNHEAFSFVLNPALPSSDATVSLTSSFFNVQPSPRCSTDFLQVLQLKALRRWGFNNGEDWRWCGRRGTYSMADESGFIGMFFSDGQTVSDGFSFEYSTGTAV